MTPEEINRLPTRVKAYIHDLETNADPAGTIQDLAAQRENCAAMTERYRRLAAALKYKEGDRIISPAAELERLQQLSKHLEMLLGKVWDLARDHTLDFPGRVDAIMSAIRTCPGEFDSGLGTTFCRKPKHHDGDCGWSAEKPDG